MRIVTAVIVALVVTGGFTTTAAAQGPPRDCLWLLEIKGGTFTTTITPMTRIKCDLGGEIHLAIWNQDPSPYSVQLKSFRFKSSTPSLCDGTVPPGESPLPKSNGTGHVQQITFPVGAYKVATPHRKIKKPGVNKTECYKFDLVLTDEDGEETTWDPELEVTEPPPPPPLTGQNDDAVPPKPKPKPKGR